MQTIMALWKRSLKDFIRDRTRLIFSILVPFFFVYVFSAIFQDDSIENPVAYLLAGIIIASVLEASLSVASSTIDDIVSGFMKEVLVSPTKRIYVAIGQLLASTTVATIGGTLTIIIGLFVGLSFTNIITPILTLLTMLVVGLAFSGLGLYLALITKSTQTFQVVRSAVTMPLVFLSGAYLPLQLLPNVLRYIAYINPMSYITALFRTIILEKTNLTNEELVDAGLAININGFIVTPFISLFIVLIFALIFLILSTNIFIKVDFSRINRNYSKEDFLV